MSQESKQVVPSKIGFFGGTGSGKTTTAALLAIGISKELHGGAPVYVYDTEPGWQFMRRPFVTEGIELIQHRQRSFKGMVEHLAIAEKKGACVFVTDSMTHVWTELTETFQNRYGRVDFPDWNLIKKEWGKWTVKFLNSPMHCMALGRLGYEYEQTEKEVDGKIRKEIQKGDSKFKAGGGESFGYEPHLLVEMELDRENTHQGRGGTLIHSANILKDRTRILNGDIFEFSDVKGYKEGGYKAVYEKFLPHLEELQFTEGLATIAEASSASLKPESDSSYAQQRRNREVAIESIEASFTLLWPGSGKEEKQLKIKALEVIFGTRAWSKVTGELTNEELDLGLSALRAYEEKAKAEKPSTEDGVLNLLTNCKQQVREALQEQVF